MEPFKLERFFDIYEFKAPYLLCCSDCEPLHLNEVLAAADSKLLDEFNNMRLSYTPTRGSPAFREEVVKTHYTNVKPDQVLAVVPEEGIYLAMMCGVEKGDHVVVTYPGYQSLYEIARSRGAEVSQWRLKEGPNDELYFDIADLQAVLRPNTTMVIINFPHNPTGCMITREQLDEVVGLCRERGAYLFSDEMYRFLAMDAKDDLPAAADVYEKGVSLGGMSKSFALPGLRVGWLATRDAELLGKCTTYKDYTTICPAGPSEHLALIALRNKDAFVARNIAIVRENSALVTDFCKRNPGVFAWVPPTGGSTGFPKLVTGQSIDEFCEQLVENHGILLLPSTYYDYESPRFRLGLGRTDFAENFKRFEKALEGGKVREGAMGP